MTKLNISRKVIFICLLSAQVALSCNDSKKERSLDENMLDNRSKGGIHTSLAEKPEDILKDYRTWYCYTYYNINLSKDFIGLDKDSNAKEKDAFLKLLVTGNYVPVKIYEKENLPYYKLYTLNSNDMDIRRGIRQIAKNELMNYNMEGKELPAYNLEDLHGRIYNKVNTNGKIIVLKCWFIHCVACVKEFPELNRLVNEYKDRKDILFHCCPTKNSIKFCATINC